MEKIFILFVFAIITIYFVEFLLNMEKTENFRLEQIQKSFDKNKDGGKFKEQVVKYANKNAKHIKKYNLETLSLQAGRTLSYGEIIFQKLMTGLIVGIIVGVVLKNPFMGLLFAGIGQMVPTMLIQRDKNKRYETLNEQIGPMMYMLNKRYENTGDFYYALELTADEYIGIEPMHQELRITISEIAETGLIKPSLDNLARRTGNYYLQLLSDYFEIAYEIGSDTSKELLNQAYEQFEEDRKMKELLENELSQVVKESYIMIGAVPVFVIFSAIAMPDFIPVITEELVGKVAITAVALVVLLCIWFVNKFVNAPLE